MNKEKLTVLLAPLDWGLGHVTRCIPLVQYFIKNDFNVLMAVNQSQKKMLINENIFIEYVNLSGYCITYSKNKWRTSVNILLQIPKIIMAIRNENKWLNNFCKSRKVDLIISDNRYGFFHKNISSVFITHQLQIQTGNKIGNWILQKINFNLIQNFNECWIPDFEDPQKSLAGVLSHPTSLPKISIQYLGILTRFKEISFYSSENVVLIILSGPEPQRTILENKILQGLENIKAKTVLVRGLINSPEINISNSFVTIFNYVNSEQLEKLVINSTFIICRSGYSSLMDYLFLKKKMCLIPTPAQTEQNYLATYFQEKKWAIYEPQNNFKLEVAIEKMNQFNFQFPSLENNFFENIVDDTISLVLEKSERFEINCK